MTSEPVRAPGHNTDAAVTTRWSPLPVAAYMWSPSAYGTLVEAYRRDLRSLAVHLRLPPPSFFEDTGRRANDERPALCCLLDLVAGGIFQVVLIPGTFMFGTGAADVAAVVGHITASGCGIAQLAPPQE
ncbi:hypothetical protein ACFUAG_13475 [Streptomyces sp. NPDC057193]|uniref:hypothetical protein n=1 Tax=Streptomyces sp. NPDC057193 TaxID=3346043 RepID=UPI003635E7D1